MNKLVWSLVSRGITWYKNSCSQVNPIAKQSCGGNRELRGLLHAGLSDFK